MDRAGLPWHHDVCWLSAADPYVVLVLGGPPDRTGAGQRVDTNFGFSGMARLVADLRDATSRKGRSRRFGEHREYVRQRLHECLQREYTGPDGTRPMYAEFMDEVRAPEVAELSRESGRGWRAVSRPPDDFAALADLVQSTMDIERLAVATMAEWQTATG